MAAVMPASVAAVVTVATTAVVSVAATAMMAMAAVASMAAMVAVAMPTTVTATTGAAVAPRAIEQQSGAGLAIAAQQSHADECDEHRHTKQNNAVHP